VRHAIVAFAALLPVPRVPAQDPDHVHQPYYTTRQQESDGSWSAERGGGRAIARLRVTALMLLAKLGDGTKVQPVADKWKGSELEHEPESLKQGLQWLRKQQDQKGRIALRSDTDWLLDHAIASYVLTEALRTTAWFELAPDACRAVEALRREVEIARPAPGPEVRLWCAMIARSLRAIAKDDKAEPARTGCRAAAVALAASLATLPAAVATSAREQAADNLRVILTGAEGRQPDAAWLEEPLRDPLTSFYAFVATWHRSGKEWTEARKRVNDRVLRQQVRVGEQRDSWDPVGEFGAENGRYGTTAAALLLVETYSSYGFLDIFTVE